MGAFVGEEVAVTVVGTGVGVDVIREEKIGNGNSPHAESDRRTQVAVASVRNTSSGRINSVLGGLVI